MVYADSYHALDLWWRGVFEFAAPEGTATSPGLALRALLDVPCLSEHTRPLGRPFSVPLRPGQTAHVFPGCGVAMCLGEIENGKEACQVPRLCFG